MGVSSSKEGISVKELESTSTPPPVNTQFRLEHTRKGGHLIILLIWICFVRCLESPFLRFA
ncbi:hypothetical protein DEO72_LG6g1528 [Vigna unguiculata]|uniref:Uncharacterized protein n=1 Tax=Vigna unguiculata TaxID=3917 RepID=A0A4D6M8I3_VIGUN|nr:hypothetical protein DEO72_LG6g1528 [Vigna unguiculata]